MLGKCTHCQEVFNRVGAEGLCPQCEDRAARFARQVDDYVAYHTTRDVATIVAATRVPREFVERYLEGASPAAAHSGARPRTSRCIRCGVADAVVGPHCKRCALAVRQQMHTVAEEVTQPAAGRPTVRRVSIAEERRERTTGHARLVGPPEIETT